MSLELLIGIIGCIGVIGAFIWNLVQSRDTVRGREFGILRDTVTCVTDQLKTTREELRRAEKRIDELEAENAELRGRVAELEAENAQLKRAKEAGGDRGDL